MTNEEKKENKSIEIMTPMGSHPVLKDNEVIGWVHIIDESVTDEILKSCALVPDLIRLDEEPWRVTGFSFIRRTAVNKEFHPGIDGPSVVLGENEPLSKQRSEDA